MTIHRKSNRVVVVEANEEIIPVGLIGCRHRGFWSRWGRKKPI